VLNITGGGEELFKKDKELFYLKPSKVFDLDFNKEEIHASINELFGF